MGSFGAAETVRAERAGSFRPSPALKNDDRLQALSKRPLHIFGFRSTSRRHEWTENRAGVGSFFQGNDVRRIALRHNTPAARSPFRPHIQYPVDRKSTRLNSSP